MTIEKGVTFYRGKASDAEPPRDGESAVNHGKTSSWTARRCNWLKVTLNSLPKATDSPPYDPYVIAGTDGTVTRLPFASTELVPVLNVQLRGWPVIPKFCAISSTRPVNTGRSVEGSSSPKSPVTRTNAKLPFPENSIQID